jgi:hypothetical protein
MRLLEAMKVLIITSHSVGSADFAENSLGSYFCKWMDIQGFL